MPCVNNITNGAPLILFRGTEDLSERQVPIDPAPRPQHLPIYIIQSEKGPLTPQVVFGFQRDLMYGSTTFSETGLFTNHQTIGSNLASAAANSQILWRVSAGAKASLVLSLEVTPADIPLYQRDADGKYLTHAVTGALIPVIPAATVAGYLLRWVVSGNGGADVGSLTSSVYTQGGMTDPTTVYPIMELVMDNPGAFGDNTGIRLYADTRSGAVDETNMYYNKAFPYRFSIVSRTSSTASPTFVTTVTNERTVNVTLSPLSVTREGFTTSTYAQTVINTQYANTTDPRYSLKYSPFGNNVHVYQNNVNTILNLVGQAELDYLTSDPAAITGIDTSILADTNGFGLMNLASAKDHTDVPYYAVVIDEAASPGNSVRLGQYTTVYGRGGADNIMSVADYEAAVIAIMDRYADCSDEVQDIARRPESIFYDTGFTLNTKLALAPFISMRPDLNLVLSTHEDSRQVKGYTGAEPAGSSSVKTMTQEIATAALLQNRIRLIPESEFYGTPTMRAIIFAGSGILRLSEWRARVPITMDMMYKACRYMGSSDAQWKPAERFSRPPGSILTLLEDISIPWVPADTRVRNWDAGINMALSYNETLMSMPACQTVYPDDTSVLNNWLTTLAIAYLNKICHAAWREFRGVDDLSNSELETAVNGFVKAKINGIWDNRFLVIPNAQVTTDDDLRGTSWHLNVQFGATNARTTEIVQITAYRRADLEALA